MIKKAMIKPIYPIEVYEETHADLPTTVLTVLKTEERIKRGPFIGQRVWVVVHPEYLANGTEIMGMWIPECDLKFDDRLVTIN